jgi:ComF family protein
MIHPHPLKYIKSFSREMYYAVIHFFLPHFCLACSTTEIEHNEIICDSCWSKLLKAPSNDIIMNELNNKLSGECCFSGAFSLWKFSPATQTIIHHLKYRAFGNLAGKIGKEMANKLLEHRLISPSTLLIPIPLHKTRIRERGYNQSSLLCKAITQETDIPFEENVLVRVRYTTSQTKLDVKKRWQNVENAFSVLKPEKILDKTIILVDDVITTGATMNACAGELLKNAAKNVYIISAAKA